MGCEYLKSRFIHIHNPNKFYWTTVSSLGPGQETDGTNWVTKESLIKVPFYKDVTGFKGNQQEMVQYDS